MPATYPFEAEDGRRFDIIAGSMNEARTEAERQAGGPVTFRSKLPIDTLGAKMPTEGPVPIVLLPDSASAYVNRKADLLHTAAWETGILYTQRLLSLVTRETQGDKHQEDLDRAWTNVLNMLSLMKGTASSGFDAFLRIAAMYLEIKELPDLSAEFQARVAAHRSQAAKQADDHRRRNKEINALIAGRNMS